MRIRRPFLYPVSGTIRFFSHILTREVPIWAGAPSVSRGGKTIGRNFWHIERQIEEPPVWIQVAACSVGQTGYSQPIPKAGIGGSPRFAARTPIGIFERGAGLRLPGLAQFADELFGVGGFEKDGGAVAFGRQQDHAGGVGAVHADRLAAGHAEPAGAVV